VLDAARLADVYRSATVGVVLSLTNPSLIPLEMMACGLACIDVAGDPTRATFGTGGPVELVAPDPLALADAIERLLDSAQLRAERSRAGVAWIAPRTWAAAAEQVEAGLRAAR
jgi:glycosyltransferase involved in cell wall biosynthesis